jgi:coproporphyrinogen III oxidase
MPNKEEIMDFFKSLQDQICHSLEQTDGKSMFQEDKWEHKSGGGGRTRLLKNGGIIEKGGVNFSAVEGALGEEMKKTLNIKENADFFATGVSIVQHPKNPMVPIIHMNVRYFELSNGTYWFGGGIDLTPHYLDEVQAKWFHQQLKVVCDKHGVNFYSDFKKKADDYFYLPHREETRGVGGIFFDHLNDKSLGLTKRQIFNFVKDVGQIFAPIYTHLMEANAVKPFTIKNKDWQFLRRGRYVEFNLVWDRGTKFGLVTGGRTESILMSLPPQANWEYCHEIEAKSEEEKIQNALKKGIDWVNL